MVLPQLRFRSASALCLSAVALGACRLTYAPPTRGLHAGMPGRLTAGQLELVATAGGSHVLPTIGGPQLAFALSDRLLIEAGANVDLLETYGANWAMGWAGARVTRRMPIASALHLIFDHELGAGGGVGGRIYGDPKPWTELFSYGIYEGVGLGLKWRWLGVYARGRVDATAGRAPTTLWPTIILGLEVRPRPWFSFGLGAGYGAYWNTRDGLVARWFYQAQLALIFDLQQATPR